MGSYVPYFCSSRNLLFGFGTLILSPFNFFPYISLFVCFFISALTDATVKYLRFQFNICSACLFSFSICRVFWANGKIQSLLSLQASEDAKKLVNQERSFACAEIESARAVVQRFGEALEEEERISQTSGKQVKIELFDLSMHICKGMHTLAYKVSSQV